MQIATDWLPDLLKYATGTSVLAAVLGWLLKHILETNSKADLKRFELDLKHSHEESLAAYQQQLEADLSRFRMGLKHSHDESLAAYKQKLETDAKSDERIRSEILLWANPILDAAISLQKRLENILRDGAHPALDPSFVQTDWSIASTYFVPSTLYLFGRYFCWIQLLRLELNFELFKSLKEMEEFFLRIDAVAKALGDYPPLHDDDGNPQYYKGDGNDTQVFRLQQQGIGELLAVRCKNGRACQSYAHFCSKLTDSKFNDARYESLFGPVFGLIDRLAPNQKRWRRLTAVNVALLALIDHCRAVLNIHRP